MIDNGVEHPPLGIYYDKGMEGQRAHTKQGSVF